MNTNLFVQKKDKLVNRSNIYAHRYSTNTSRNPSSMQGRGSLLLLPPGGQLRDDRTESDGMIENGRRTRSLSTLSSPPPAIPNSEAWFWCTWPRNSFSRYFCFQVLLRRTEKYFYIIVFSPEKVRQNSLAFSHSLQQQFWNHKYLSCRVLTGSFRTLKL